MLVNKLFQNKYLPIIYGENITIKQQTINEAFMICLLFCFLNSILDLFCAVCLVNIVLFIYTSCF
jgi:hypothetical protein